MLWEGGRGGGEENGGALSNRSFKLTWQIPKRQRALPYPSKRLLGAQHWPRAETNTAVLWGC